MRNGSTMEGLPRMFVKAADPDVPAMLKKRQGRATCPLRPWKILLTTIAGGVRWLSMAGEYLTAAEVAACRRNAHGSPEHRIGALILRGLPRGGCWQPLLPCRPGCVRQSARPVGVAVQAVFVSEDDGVYAVAQPEFHQDAAHVGLHRGFGHEHALADLGVGESCGNG